MSAILIACIISSSVMAGVSFSVVAPEGDGIVGRDRYGYFSIWESSAFDTGANPNAAYHWYTSWDASGSSRDTYLQVSLASLPAADAIVQATFNINLLSKSDDGDGLLATIMHAANSSTANGNASQKIGGTQNVGTVSMTDELGWLSFDVTDYIKSDVANGYSWAAFSVTPDGYSSMTFSSGEDSANAPFLKVWDSSVVAQQPLDVPTVPVPSSLGLAAMGVLGWLRRRRA